MSVAKRRRGESSRERIVSDANPSRCGRNVHGVKRTVGETSCYHKYFSTAEQIEREVIPNSALPECVAC